MLYTTLSDLGVDRVKMIRELVLEYCGCLLYNHDFRRINDGKRINGIIRTYAEEVVRAIILGSVPINRIVIDYSRTTRRMQWFTVQKDVTEAALGAQQAGQGQNKVTQ